MSAHMRYFIALTTKQLTYIKNIEERMIKNMKNLTDVINNDNNRKDDDEMSNRIPVAKKISLINEHKPIIDTIYYLGNGFLMTKQLLELLDKMHFGSNISNQSAISELLKNDVLTKKQCLGTKNNILVLNAIAISVYTGEPTRNIAKPNMSEKTILNNIQKIELMLHYIKDISAWYQKDTLTAWEIREFFITQGGTYPLLPKNSIEYYNILNELFEKNDLWGTNFYEDIAVLRVEHANLVNQMCKYEESHITIDESDQNIYDMVSSLKNDLPQQKQCQEYWTFKNLMNSSADINFISFADNKIEAQLIIYDNGSLCAEKIAQLSSWFYLMMDRYKNKYQTKVHISVYVCCLNRETLDFVQADCNSIAEDRFGYTTCTRFQSLCFQQNFRFPYCTDNVDLYFIDSQITNKYNITAN